MSLEVHGIAILSYDDLAEIMRGMADQGPSEANAPLAAWISGEDVPPEEIYATLDVWCRLQDTGDNPRLSVLIDAALQNLREGFPETFEGWA